MKIREKLFAGAAYGVLLGMAIPAAAEEWTQTSAPYLYWLGVACSTDGTKLIAAGYSDEHYNPAGLYRSSDSGATWSQTSAPNQFWERVASSADGTKLAAIAYADGNWQPGGIYTSSDSGSTWRRTSAPAQNWMGVSSSADGTRLAALAWAGLIYFSTDSGRTWTVGNAASAARVHRNPPMAMPAAIAPIPMR